MKKTRLYGLMEKIGLFKMIKIMRFTIFILFLSLSQTFAVNSYSQQAKLSLDMRNARLEDVIDKIEKNSEFFFMYNKRMIDVDRKVDIQVEEKSVNEVLDKIFANTYISYSIKNRQILLINSRLADTGNESITQQQKSVSGNVTDSSGATLPGVSVIVKGTTIGIITDMDGKYTLSNVPGNAILQFSFVGMKTQEIAVGGRTSINVVLADETIGIDDVVVVGYATTKKRDLIGAVDAVDSKVIGNRANSNLVRSLQGQVAGLNISFNDGKASHQGSYNVRGTGSIGAGGSSLVLIDGVEGSLSIVNPQDVESVSVLKDASSTAVYGARGAFGVILVTTKKAQKGRPVINYNGNFSVNRRTVIPDGITDSNEWFDWWKTSYNNYYNGSKALLNNIDSKVPYSQEIYDLSAQRKADIAATGKSDIPAAMLSTAIPGFGYAYLDNHDWLKEFYRDFHTSTEHNISISGGNESSDYYVSGRFYDSKGVYKVGDEDFKKYDLRAKGSLTVRPWLKFTNNMSMSLDKNYIPMGSTTASVQQYMQHCISPSAPLRNPDGSWTPAAGVSGYAAFYEGNNYQTDDYTYLRDKISADIDIIKDVLKFQADYSYNYTGQTRTRVRNYVTYSKDPGVYILESTAVGNGMTQTNYDTRYQAANAYSTYTPRLGEDNSLTVLLGYNAEWSKYASLAADRTGFLSDKYSFNLMDGQASLKAGGNEWAYLGAFSRVNYSYKGRYLAEVSARYDGSSKFPSGQRWGIFPSASLGWRISDESWMNWSRRYLDNFKLRVSAGSMGNGNVSPYMYASEMTVSKATDFILNGSLASYTGVATAVPLSLTWETSSTYDAGFDLDMFKGKLSASFDYYIRMTSDMYTAGVQLPGVYGGTVPKGNNAELRTNGWETSIQWRDQIKVAGKPLSYSIKGTLWDSYSTITKFVGNKAGAFGSISNLIDNMGQPQYYEGMRIGEMWGYTVEGLFKDYQDIANSPTQEYKQASDKKTRPGMVKFADLDGSGNVDYGSLSLADHGDISKIGNSTPRYRYGVNLAANWNGIGLSVFLQGVAKRDWYPGPDAGYFWGKYSRPFFYFIPSIQALDNPNVAQLNDDQTECLNYNTAYWPRVTTYMANGDKNQTTIMNLPNTRYKQNAAYLRVKTIQLDYTFKQDFTKKIGLSSLKVFLTGENLFVFTPLHKWAPNLDPEGIDGGDSDFGNSGINGNSYPMLKNFTFGINLTF
jgi:TonB-linked SusC/RagA family outer membrane protein